MTGIAVAVAGDIEAVEMVQFAAVEAKTWISSCPWEVPLSVEIDKGGRRPWSVERYRSDYDSGTDSRVGAVAIALREARRSTAAVVDLGHGFDPER